MDDDGSYSRPPTRVPVGGDVPPSDDPGLDRPLADAGALDEAELDRFDGTGVGAEAVPEQRATAGRGRRLLRVVLRIALATLVLLAAVIVLLRFVPPPTSAMMLRHAWIEGRWPEHIWAPWAEISPHLALAVVAAEDQRFPEHRGLDTEAIADALEEAREGARRRGASTITQQVAKNLFLWPGRSWVRKGLEAGLALALEVAWPKERILEVYLNVAQLGDDVFGAEAASRRYFGKSAARLTPEEAALLAAVLPNPVRFRVDRPSAWVRERQGWILRQMHQLGGTAYVDFRSDAAP